ncbi:MAG: class I SAM-dependent methyltransferase [Proteobacteria bacterium]|nr:class I SAM-dependent methyltransferase [Pseudomonadota bacterium]
MARVNAKQDTGTILYEDDHILVANKPNGIATHSPESGQTAFVEQLSQQKGFKLGVHQRLDAETSGVIAFSKTPQGAQRLSKAFELRTVKKCYRALVVGIPPEMSAEMSHRLTYKNGLTQVDEQGKLCKSRYRVIKSFGPFALIELDLLTGMTHQLRVLCALSGFPILGDKLYGGGDQPPRLYLHAYKLRLTSEPNLPTFEAPAPDLLARPSLQGILNAILNNIGSQFEGIPDSEAIRLSSPQHSGIPELIFEKIAQTLLIRHLEPAEKSLWDVPSLHTLVHAAQKTFGCDSFVYRVHENPGKVHPCRKFQKEFACDVEPLTATEHGIVYRFDLSGNAVGLYLDQRENRAWVMQHAHGSVLNLFAYTCAFSLCAAKCKEVASTTSIDAASAALRRGRENFELNQIPLEGHRFITEDVFKYLNRCDQNSTHFETIICDPPSFGRFGKIVFSLEKDLESLLLACLMVLAPGGTLLFSVNHRKIRLAHLRKAFDGACARLHIKPRQIEIFVNDDALGPLGVGTDLKTLRAYF